nr:DUF2293 domain-containing protein [Devosia sp. YR412]
MRKHHPGCPEFAVEYIAEKIVDRDWEEMSLGAAVGTTMQGIIRHAMTDYDNLLLAGVERVEARRRVQKRVNALLDVWSRPRTEDPNDTK